jgi:hypothetical protein
MGQYGFSRNFGYTPPKVPKYRNSGGGVAYNPHTHVPRVAGGPPTAGGLTGPPAGSFDPALEAQRRAAQRGMHDTLQDTASERHFGEVDLTQALRDIHTSSARRRQKLGIDFGRSTEKLGRDYERGNERISNEESDTKLKGERTNADFVTKLADIGRQFGELGHRQGEASNAAGVNDEGTSAAAAAARARNQQLAEAPIHTAQDRLNQDLYTALTRLGTSRSQLTQDRDTALGQLEQDRGIAGSQLKQDRDRERLLSKRDFGRTNFTLGRKEQRTRREGAISNVDLLEQEIYNARQSHPGAVAAQNRKKGKR